MNIHGREVGFKLTVGAAIDISKLCPNGDLTKIATIMDCGYDAALMANVTIAAAMSNGYENAKRFEEPGYKPNPLTVDEILSLDANTLSDLLNEALSVFKVDQNTTVAVKASKKTKGKYNTEFLLADFLRTPAKYDKARNNQHFFRGVYGFDFLPCYF